MKSVDVLSILDPLHLYCTYNLIHLLRVPKYVFTPCYAAKMTKPVHMARKVLPLHPPHNEFGNSQNHALRTHASQTPQQDRLSYESPLSSLPPHIQHNSNEQGAAKDGRSNTIVIFDRSPVADSLTSVQINTDRVEQREDSDESESEGSEEGSS